MSRLVHFLIAILLLGAPTALAESWLILSVPDQEIMLVENGIPQKRYDVSTSKFGLGDRNGSYRTPTGTLEIAQKIGTNAPLGAVFKSRQRTGEILRPNSPGRDPIVTRILWLRGLQAENSQAYERAIYIHGTPQERLIGRPASYGCVRMRSRDVADLYSRVNVGTRIRITNSKMRNAYRTFAVERRRSGFSS